MHLSQISEWASITGAALTLGGIVLTLLVFLGVKKIRSYYSFNIRMPDLIQKLRDHNSSLQKQFRDFDSNKKDIQYEINQIIAIMETVEHKTLKDLRQKIKVFLKNNEDLTDSPEKETAWKFYSDTAALITRISELVEDRKWDYK